MRIPRREQDIFDCGEPCHCPCHTGEDYESLVYGSGHPTPDWGCSQGCSEEEWDGRSSGCARVPGTEDEYLDFRAQQDDEDARADYGDMLYHWAKEEGELW